MVYRFLKILLGPIVRLIWIKKVEGLENILKSGSLIIAANHSSYFDFISLIVVCPRRIHFLAAEKFYKSWFWYPIVKLTGHIKVERQEQNKEEVYKKVYSILNNGGVIGIFPEGTRSVDGEIQKAFTGVAKFSLGAKTSVLPIGINGTYEILPRQKKIPKFRKIIKIKIGQPLVFEEYYSQEQSEELLRGITDKIMMEITNLTR